MLLPCDQLPLELPIEAEKTTKIPTVTHRWIQNSESSSTDGDLQEYIEQVQSKDDEVVNEVRREQANSGNETENQVVNGEREHQPEHPTEEDATGQNTEGVEGSDQDGMSDPETNPDQEMSSEWSAGEGTGSSGREQSDTSDSNSPGARRPRRLVGPPIRLEYDGLGQQVHAIQTKRGTWV